MILIAHQGRSGSAVFFEALRSQILVVWTALTAPHSVVVVR